MPGETAFEPLKERERGFEPPTSSLGRSPAVSAEKPESSLCDNNNLRDSLSTATTVDF